MTNIYWKNVRAYSHTWIILNFSRFIDEITSDNELLRLQNDNIEKKRNARKIFKEGKLK